MQEFAIKAIEDLNRKIAALEHCRNGLVDIYGGPAPAPAQHVSRGRPRSTGPVRRPAAKKRGFIALPDRPEPGSALADATRNGSGMTVADAFRRVIRRRTEPFNNAYIRDEAFLQFPDIRNKIRNAVSITLEFLREKGEIERVSGQGRSSVWKTVPRESMEELHRRIRGEVDAELAQAREGD